MKIAIFGATSQIAKDLVISFFENTSFECVLFSRDVVKVEKQFRDLGLKISYLNLTYDEFSEHNSFDLIINFVGVGDPAAIRRIGAGILDITEHYDNLALNYLKVHPSCKYIFISSGAVYGGSFERSVNENTQATININNLKETDWYAIAKLYAEAKHRALGDYSIIDIRVFNYFSHTLDMNTRFLITDIVRAIKMKEVLQTSEINIVRDFITPEDFVSMVKSIINVPSINLSVDCYTKAPIDKLSLLSEMAAQFDLKYVLVEEAGMNATGVKVDYYSTNQKLSMFGYKPRFGSLDGVVAEVRDFFEY